MIGYVVIGLLLAVLAGYADHEHMAAQLTTEQASLEKCVAANEDSNQTISSLRHDSQEQTSEWITAYRDLDRKFTDYRRFVAKERQKVPTNTTKTTCIIGGKNEADSAVVRLRALNH